MKNGLKERISIKNMSLVILVISIVLLGTFLHSYRKVIFQRGNPIPYLISAMSLDNDTKFIEIEEETGVYISKRGEYTEFFDFIEKSYDVDFIEQAGSGFIFSNGDENITVGSEIYLKYFTVWTM